MNYPHSHLGPFPSAKGLLGYHFTDSCWAATSHRPAGKDPGRNNTDRGTPGSREGHKVTHTVTSTSIVLDSLVVELPRPFGTLQQQRSYCKQQTLFFTSDIIALPFFFTMPCDKTITTVVGCPVALLSPTVDSIFQFSKYHLYFFPTMQPWNCEKINEKEERIQLLL